MKRPEQHETDSAADALFRDVFHQWAITPSERDYGWDHVVEVFRNGESTGLLFNGQLKGSRHTGYSADRSFISQELEIDSADYLARQLRQPTFLFHADVQSKVSCSGARSNSTSRFSRSWRGAKSKGLTVRIPTANVLPDRFNEFAQDLRRSQTVVVSRILMDTTHVEFADAMKSQPVERISQVAEDLHAKGYHLELQAAFLQRKGGDIAGAITAIHKVAASAEVSGGHIEVQFNAILASRRTGVVAGVEIRRSAGAGRRYETRYRSWNSAGSRNANREIFTCLLRSPVKPRSYRWRFRRRAACS